MNEIMDRLVMGRSVPMTEVYICQSYHKTWYIMWTMVQLHLYL